MSVAAHSSQVPVVVLLDAEERQRLDELSAAEHVSSSEILRRSLRSYPGDLTVEDDVELAAQVADINLTLDRMLTSIESARAEIHENLRKIERMKAEAAKDLQ